MLWTLLLLNLPNAMKLPGGPTPDSLALPHFPDKVYAFVWRNWELVPADRMAKVLGASAKDVEDMGHSMGLSGPPKITEDQIRRSYITVIRRNWHLLPYEQLLELLGWPEEELAYVLREDDFLYIKLGLLKPKCEPLKYTPPSPESKAKAAAIAQIMKEQFPQGVGVTEEPLFQFVKDLSEPVPQSFQESKPSLFSPRYCYSYFALYGDPLMDKDLDPFPEGYLARLAQSGVNGVWLQAVLYKLYPFPWDESMSQGHEQRIKALKALVDKAKKAGVGVYLYLNEPRAMPISFHEAHPGLKGVAEGEFATLCTSVPEVQEYLRNAVAHIAEEVPDLAGFFTITASENLTSCWSHHSGNACAKCGPRGDADVIAEVNRIFQEGIDQAGSKAQFIAWDWGWNDAHAKDTVDKLPDKISLMSVSEWSIPIQRGGIPSVVGEYSISTIGPGPRATAHWGFAKARGLKTLAKVQFNNTWELSPVPYVPVVANVAEHTGNLREAGVSGLMLGWTLGGCPSPNLEVVAEMGRPDKPSVDEALNAVALHRFGDEASAKAVEAWKTFSMGFREYPFNIGGVYSGPQHMGPANLLYGQPSGYRGTMVGFPYDDMDQWRTVYPPDVFASQFEKMAQAFDQGIVSLQEALNSCKLTADQKEALSQEKDVAEACAIHLRSVAQQVRFIMARNVALSKDVTDEAKSKARTEMKDLLQKELDLAKRLYAIQSRDSRMGFEASNHYFYVPLDLAEKVLNCEDLLQGIES